jgi:hypothetical protein
MTTRLTDKLFTVPIRGTLLASMLALVSVTPAQAQESYGFVRTVEGYAELIQSGSQSLAEVTENYPLLVGDRLRVTARARLEAVLPDGAYLRVGGDTEIAFTRLARSADTQDQQTVLQLAGGEIQIVLPADTAEQEALRIDTANATVYLNKRGSYRIRADGAAWTEVLAREGFAEIVTARGSELARTGEQVTVQGSQEPRLWVEAAGAKDPLEHWGDELLAAANYVEPSYVEPSLAYSAAPLYRHGSWVSVGGRYAWRPRVKVGWRPYHAGWWRYTPSGLTWVSTEPWGWVTYHYGGWSHTASFGWVWYPGHVYTPASVYWYWGPTYVGWVPAGYYNHYYWPSYTSWGFGFHYGVFGWAGGSIHHWRDWTFCSHRHFGHRNRHHYYRTGSQLAHHGGLKHVERGVIAADTRALKPELWSRPQDGMRALSNNRGGGARTAVTGGEMPDVTPWVARQRNLPNEVERAVRPRTASTSADRGQIAATAGRSVARRTEVRQPDTVPEARRRINIQRTEPNTMEFRGTRRAVGSEQRIGDGIAPGRGNAGTSRAEVRPPTDIGSRWMGRPPNPETQPGPVERVPGADARSRSVRRLPDADTRTAPPDRTPGADRPTRRDEARAPGRAGIAPVTPSSESWRSRPKRSVPYRIQTPQPQRPDAAPGSSVGGVGRQQDPVVRRVWDGVRSYRERSRTEYSGPSIGQPRSSPRTPITRPPTSAQPGGRSLSPGSRPPAPRARPGSSARPATPGQGSRGRPPAAARPNSSGGGRASAAPRRSSASPRPRAPQRPPN